MSRQQGWNGVAWVDPYYFTEEGWKTYIPPGITNTYDVQTFDTNAGHWNVGGTTPAPWSSDGSIYVEAPGEQYAYGSPPGLGTPPRGDLTLSMPVGTRYFYEFRWRMDIVSEEFPPDGYGFVELCVNDFRSILNPHWKTEFQSSSDIPWTVTRSPILTVESADIFYTDTPYCQIGTWVGIGGGGAVIRTYLDYCIAYAEAGGYAMCHPQPGWQPKAWTGSAWV